MTRPAPKRTLRLAAAETRQSRPVGDGSIGLITATVTAVTEESLFLRLADDRSEPAWRAAGCLLEPVEGDVVLCAPVGDGIAVLNILTRTASGEATVSVPGAEVLALAQNTLAIRAGEVTIDSETVTVRSASSRLIGKAVTAIADSLETVVKQLRRVADQEISSAGDSVRIVHNTETLKARHLTHEADQTMTLRSHVTVIDASGDVRVNGERISLG
ncbi:MAG: DUF3540 domain-containing protein [Thalassobaculaceae bacterium]|nr:DUF3540 domain-containing protein [Thalassobaculaceae bacterium]